VIYYNEACTMCAMYIKDELIPTLEEAGISKIVKKDYVNEKKNRLELNELNEKYLIPPELQGHFMVFIDENIVLGGHVPKQIIMDLLLKKVKTDKILVLQDEMDNAKSYFAWGFKGEAKEYPINTPISEYVDWFNANKASLTDAKENYASEWRAAKMLPLIVVTGFLDGLNPCAFAVLLFFIAFLFTIRKTKRNVLAMGLVYIFAIFIAYFLIGLGLLKAFIFTGAPHLMARIGAYLLIILGLINVANFLLPNKSKIRLGVPAFSKKYIKLWIYRATLPAAFVAGFLVGLCTFPCSGGMYVAIIGLLSAKTTMLQGLIYLVIYNILFVVPLVIILLATSSKRMADKINKWEESEKKHMKLILGVVMIALGLAILFWFI
ncbi:hypothetical protein D6777_02210, partial [Candidatus Woesearchaeota archaeon]